MVSGGTGYTLSTHSRYTDYSARPTHLPTYLVVVRHVKVVLGEVRLSVVRRSDDPVGDHVPAPSPTRASAMLWDNPTCASPTCAAPTAAVSHEFGSLVRFGHSRRD